MGERRRQQVTSYFHPGTGWGDDPEGATLRLSARLSGRVTSVVENRIEVAREGSWSPLGDREERDLPPIQRGMVWYGWRSAIAGEPYLMLRGVRAVDEVMASTLLDTLVVYDHQGDELDDASLAGLRFALRTADAAVFASRVKGAGGHILPVAADLGDIARHHDTLAAATARLEEAATWAQAVIGEGGRGIALDVHRIEERAQEVWETHRGARRALASLGPAHEALAAAGRTLDEQVKAQTLADEAAVLSRRAEEAFALYRGCEGEAVRMLARTGQDDGLGQHLALIEDEGADVELLGQLAARLTAAGQEARLSDSALVVTVPGGEVLISADQVRLRRRAPASAA